jgi:hypothetical protein
MDRPKIIDRAMKLLRTAADGASTENEKQIAAIQAAKLVIENNLVIAEPPPPPQRRKPPRPAPPQPPPQPRSRPVYRSRPVNPVPGGGVYEDPEYRPSQYEEIEIRSPIACVACGRTLNPGEIAWREVTTNWYRHHDITCDTNYF